MPSSFERGYAIARARARGDVGASLDDETAILDAASPRGLFRIHSSWYELPPDTDRAEVRDYLARLHLGHLVSMDVRDEGILRILDGLTFGRTAPPADVRRRLPHLALVVGHPNDLVHPFSDADRTARELVRGRLVAADSMYEWRVRPSRLDTELREFLRVAWSEPQPVAGVLAAASA